SFWFVDLGGVWFMGMIMEEWVSLQATCLEPTGLAQLAIKGVFEEVVTTCERSQVRVSPWGFSFKVGICGVLLLRMHRFEASSDYLLGMYCEIESLIIIRGWQGLPFG
ncbi:hypothetical protein Tco_1432067, partial [Tanacetum coccineum]